MLIENESSNLISKDEQEYFNGVNRQLRQIRTKTNDWLFSFNTSVNYIHVSYSMYASLLFIL